MSNSYSDSSAIFGPISEGVAKQLKLRKKIVSKRVERTPNDLIYLNSTNAWVRVTSSADMEGEEGNTLARKYQLFGGIAAASGGFKPNTDTSSYTESTEYGYIPMPGITSFQVHSYGTYGALRAASFNFTVNSPEDFSKLEKLYLRPGFTILLEWGHTVRIDNDSGEIETSLQYYPIEDYLKHQKQDDILKKIEELRKINSYNYDGLFGYIKNFTWNFNGGSYECQVDVVSQGELVDSIRNIISGKNVSTKDKSTSDAGYSASTFSTDLEKVLNTIKTAPVNDIAKFSDSSLVDTDEITEGTIDALAKSWPKFATELEGLNPMVARIGGTSSSRTNAWTKYITLRDFLKLLNKANLIYDGDKNNIVKYYTGGERKNTFLTFPNHIGLDPTICVLPKSTKDLDLYYNLSNQKSDLDSNNILNIYISVDCILQSIIDLKNAENPADNTVFKLVDIILKKLETNLGDINEFISHYESDTATFYIVDTKTTPSSDDFKLDGDGLPKSYIDLVGLKSEVTALSFSSAITSAITTIVAIGASQTGDASVSPDILNLEKWNRGIKDRHMYDTSRSVERLPSQSNTKISPEKLSQFRDFLKNVNTEGNNFYVAYDSKAFLGKKEMHSNLMAEYVKEAHYEKDNFPGFMPVELTFTMKGVSGLRIMQSFKISEFFLPDAYKGRVSFIFTGLDHKVENNQWLIDVKTKLLPI